MTEELPLRERRDRIIQYYEVNRHYTISSDFQRDYEEAKVELKQRDLIRLHECYQMGEYMA